MTLKAEIAGLSFHVGHLEGVISDLRTTMIEANNRLHGIEMRLLEERAVSNAFVYDKIAELQKKMLDGSAGEPSPGNGSQGI